MITAKKPNDCSKAELENFKAFVLEGGEVSADGLETRIKKAESLLFLTQDGSLTGIAAVKNPERKYKQKVFKKAQANIEANQFLFELGWVFVLPSSRGAGFSHRLVEDALSVVSGQPIFATSRLNNMPMHRVLEAHGFFRHGKGYASRRSNQQVVLFICNAVE